MDERSTDHRWTNPVRTAGLALGPLAAGLIMLAPTPAGLGEAGWSAAAVAVWMALWWMTEAVPLAATALLPMVLFPLLGIAGARATAEPYANPLIFLFLGGFWIALAMQRWGLHRRIALRIVVRTGDRQTTLVAGMMLASASLSMWISNTATVMMMVPIAASLVAVVAGSADGHSGSKARESPGGRFATALMLGTAYGASIGGLATLVGSPPNALLAGFMAQTYQVQIGFARWMLIALPVTIVMLPLAWWLLTRVVFPLDDRRHARAGGLLEDALKELGPVTLAERRVGMVFALVAVLWVGNPLIGPWLPAGALSDASVAIAGALLLFVLPAGGGGHERLLDWEWAKRAPWEILILFGGGLSLASAVDQTGLAAWTGTGLAALGSWPALLLVAAVATLVIFMTELTSNTATTAAMLPVVAAVALQAGLDPMTLALPATLAASCAFMLPVATPPNAIVFGTGHVTIPQMMRAGLALNLLGVIAVTAVAAWIVPRVFG